MSLDCSSPDIKSALDEISKSTSSNEWVVFGYVPKSGNVLKIDAKGSGFDDFVEEFSEGKVHFGYYRVMVKNLPKFVYVAWCGEGVTGMTKGSFGNHTNDFAAFLKKGFAVHHQINARSDADLDEKKMQAALVKAAGANYDAGAKKQGMDSTAKAMGELKTFHISEQHRANETLTSGGVQIDKSASDAYWSQQKAQPKQAAPPPSKPSVDEEARKKFWAQQQAEREAAQAEAAAKKSAAPRPGGPAGASSLRSKFEQPASGGGAPPPSSAPPPAGRPAPGKINTGAFSGPPKTAAPPPSAGGAGRPTPPGAAGGGAPPKLPPSAPPASGPPKLPPSLPPSAPPSQPPSLPPSAPPVPTRMPEPDHNADDDGWGDEPAAAPVVTSAPPLPPPPAAAPPPAQYAQEEYAQEEYAQEEYAGQEEYAQEEYAQEEYAQEEYAQEEYAQEEYGQEEYAQEEYAQEEYAQEEYAQEEYATGASGDYQQVMALHDYQGNHEEDLSFKAGDWITVHERDGSGWWKGELNGAVGYFPSNFVQQ